MKKIRVAKQWGLEKMGRVEATSETNDIRFQAEKNEEHKEALKDIAKRIEKQHKVLQDEVMEGKQLAGHFALYTEKLRTFDNPDLANFVSELADLQNAIDTLKETLSRDLLNNVGQPLEFHVKSEIAEAVNFKNKYDRTRRVYDAAAAKLKSFDEKAKTSSRALGDTQKEVNDAKREFDNVTADTFAFLSTVNKKTEYSAMEKFCSLFGAYEEFFTKGSSLIAEMKPHVQYFQQAIEKGKKDYEETKTRNRSVGPVVQKTTPSSGSVISP